MLVFSKGALNNSVVRFDLVHTFNINLYFVDSKLSESFLSFWNILTGDVYESRMAWF